MRRAVVLGLLAALALPAGGGAHPGHGDFVPVDIGRFAFAPAEARVVAGDEVLWSWVGPDRDHSVTADPGQGEAFDSDPGRVPGPTTHSGDRGFSHRFATPGTYTYRCKVHASMRGTVVVEAAPPPDEAPRVEALRAPARARTRLTVRFALTEDAVVLVEVERVRDDRLVLSRSRGMTAGQGSIALGVGRLRPGAYRVRLVAVDAASNAGPAAGAVVRIVRPARARRRR